MFREINGFCKLPTILAISLAASLIAGQGPATSLLPGEFSYSTRPYNGAITFGSSASLVELRVVVRDRNANPVDGLTRENFEILDRGQTQGISHFAIERRSELPLSYPAAATAPPRQPAPAPIPAVAFFFDDLESSPAELAAARIAVKNYLHRVSADGLRVGVFTASGRNASDFTTNLRAVDGMLDQIAPVPRADARGCQPISGYQAYAITQLPDADIVRSIAMGQVIFAMRRQPCNICRIGFCQTQAKTLAQNTWSEYRLESKGMMASLARVVSEIGQQPGSRVVTLCSTGFITATLQRELNELVETALRENVVINAFEAKGIAFQDSEIPNDEVPRGQAANSGTLWMHAAKYGDMDDSMKGIARATGGDYFNNTKDLMAGNASLGIPSGVAYSMAFVPEDLRGDGVFHALSVRLVNTKPYSVAVRAGYFDSDKPVVPLESQAFREELRRSLWGRESASMFPVEFGTAPPTGGLGGIQAVAAVNPRALPFLSADGYRSDELTVVVALFDAAGKLVAGREGDMKLHLSDASFNNLVPRPRHYVMSPGS